jgi:hypothetical protein
VLGRRRPVPQALARPHRWICHLQVTRRDSNGKTTVVGGTGLLISPRHVLTAAHLVKFAQKDDRGLWVHYEVTSIRVVPARNGPAPALDGLFAKPIYVAPSESEGANPTRLRPPRADHRQRRAAETRRPEACYWGSPAWGGEYAT